MAVLGCRSLVLVIIIINNQVLRKIKIVIIIIIIKGCPRGHGDVLVVDERGIITIYYLSYTG